MEIAQNDERVLYLTADSGEGGLDRIYRNNFSDRSFDFGIAEENMVAAAAGLAATGKIPFVYTAAPFLTYRALEFIRDDICLQNMSVKLIGVGSGISVSSLGPTHHTTEDLAVLRPMPRLCIISPATPKQAYEAIKYAYEIDGPAYIRIAMNKEKEFFPDSYVLSSTGSDCIRNGEEIVIFSTGSILEEVDEAAQLLSDIGYSVSVINIFLIKPFNQEAVVNYVKSAKRLVCVVEEHNIIGGLSSIISDVMVNYGIVKKFKRIGLDDNFAKGYGKLKQVRNENGLDAWGIFNTIKETLDE